MSTKLEDWVENQVGGDEDFYFSLWGMQCDASNFLASYEPDDLIDDRLPRELAAALRLLADYEVVVSTRKDAP